MKWANLHSRRIPTSVAKKSRRSFPKKLEEAAIRQKGEEGGKEEEEEAAKLAQEEELGNQIFVSNSKIEAKKASVLFEGKIREGEEGKKNLRATATDLFYWDVIICTRTDLGI